MVKDSHPQRGSVYAQRVAKKVRNITPEQAMENFKEKQRRLAEKLGWNDNWHKKPIKKEKDLRRIKRHKSRVVHHGHGK